MIKMTTQGCFVLVAIQFMCTNELTFEEIWFDLKTSSTTRINSAHAIHLMKLN